MARTFIRQGTQIRRSEAYVDNLGAGVTLEGGAVTIEDDLNSLRSQVKRILDGQGAGRWYDDLPVVNGKRRSLAEINTGLNAVEEKKILARAQVLTDLTVPGGQNYVVLSVANNEAPTQAVAVTTNALGAVVAASAGAIAAHGLEEVAGANAISPKNLVVVRAIEDGQPIQSDGRDVYGLLQVEGGAGDGDAFNDTDRRARISFVRLTAGGDDLEAVPAGDIGGQAINYAYIFRTSMNSMAEDTFLGNGNFTDLTATVDVTLTRAVSNQGADTAVAPGNLNLQVTGTNTFNVLGADGATQVLQIGAAGTLAFNGGALDINNTDNADFAGPVVLDSGASAIRIGVTTGYIDTDTVDFGLRSGGQLYLDDAAQDGSTWAQTTGVRLSDSTLDWNNYASQFGEVSLLGAIYQAAIQGARTGKTYANVTANIAANADVGGAGGGTNLDIALPDMTNGNFVTDYDVFVNGELQRPGADAGADNDYYPGTDLAAGQLRFEYPLRTGDVICVSPYVKQPPEAP